MGGGAVQILAALWSGQLAVGAAEGEAGGRGFTPPASGDADDGGGGGDGGDDRSEGGARGDPDAAAPGVVLRSLSVVDGDGDGDCDVLALVFSRAAPRGAATATATAAGAEEVRWFEQVSRADEDADEGTEYEYDGAARRNASTSSSATALLWRPSVLVQQLGAAQTTASARRRARRTAGSDAGAAARRSVTLFADVDGDGLIDLVTASYSELGAAGAGAATAAGASGVATTDDRRVWRIAWRPLTEGGEGRPPPATSVVTAAGGGAPRRWSGALADATARATARRARAEERKVCCQQAWNSATRAAVIVMRCHVVV